LLATTKRSVLKDALKKHKRTPARGQPSHLQAVQDAINAYLPYLLALNTASGYRDIGNEEVDVKIVKPLEVEWRTTISATLSGREPPRSKVTGLHHELAFALSSLAYTYSLLARFQLRILYGSHVLTPEQRTNAIGTAMKHLLQAHSIHSFLLSLPSTAAARDAPTDIQASTITALAASAMAEATLIVVAKDDPYAAAVADDRNENNTDWMYKSPSIPKVRARLYAGIALAAVEHANQAHGLLARSTSGKIDDDLVSYANDLKRTARGKAIRFLAVNAELSGSTGEALAWLNGAKRELGMAGAQSDEGGKRKGLRGLKQSWQERCEDKRVEKGGEWGLDGGRLEECRVVEMLDAKWDRENGAVNVQLVPDFEPLLAQMPSGREYHTSEPWGPPTLDAGTLMHMQAPPEPEDRAFKGDEDDSRDEDGYGGVIGEPVGAFPGTAADSGRSKTSNSYY
jgi:hypothetical protein